MMPEQKLRKKSLGPLTAIPPGEGRVYRVGEEKIAVFRTRAGGVYAVQAECPHRGGPLEAGLVGGTTLICPLHSWKFDLVTGQALFGDCGLKTFCVRIAEQTDGGKELVLEVGGPAAT